MPIFSSVRNAWRQLLKRPAISFTIIVTLALCIGANAAIYTVVDALFFRALPYPQPDRLVLLTTRQSKQSASEVDTSQDGTQWELVRDHATLLEVAVFGSPNGVNLVANNQVEFVQSHRVGAGFFRVLGMPPWLGREFTPAEDVSNGPRVAVISYKLWQRVFRGDPHLIGRTIDLRGTPYTVVGVAQPGFRTIPAGIDTATVADVDVWTPLHPSRTGEGSGDNYGIVGRLKPGVTLPQVDAQLNAILQDRFASLHLPPGVRFYEQALPLETGLTSDIRAGVLLMWGAVLLVLVIGCVNIAGILLASSAARTLEIATRLALGATRFRIVAELFTESLLLALLGGLLGLALGELAVEGLAYLNPAEFTLNGSIHLNAGIAAMTLLVSLATSLLFGLFPAFEASTVDLRAILAEGGRSNTGSRRQWKRQSLVFAEVTLGVVLVVSAALLVRTFLNIANARPGFDPAHLTIASASLQDARYATAIAGSRLFRDSLQRMQTIPGVESAAVELASPYGRPLNDGLSQVDGHPMRGTTELNYATPGLFDTLRIPVLRGRAFTDLDSALTTPVAVVNEAFCRHFLKGIDDPIGSIIRIEGKDWKVIGVVNNVQETNAIGGGGPIDYFPEAYVPVSQFPDALFAMSNVWFSPVWIVRTRSDDPSLPQALQQALFSVDPRLPFSSFKNISTVRRSAMARQSYRATIFSVLAGLAIMLAAIGLYGLISQSVEQRKRELGIRLALGASVPGIIQTAVAPGLILSAAGVACGSFVALLAARLLKSLIWGVAPNDPLTFVLVAIVLLAIAALASFVPALQLIRLDPARTLRD
jgi:predicted permease